MKQKNYNFRYFLTKLYQLCVLIQPLMTVGIFIIISFALFYSAIKNDEELQNVYEEHIIYTISNDEKTESWNRLQECSEDANAKRTEESTKNNGVKKEKDGPIMFAQRRT